MTTYRQIKAVVSGRVQGVFFRASTREVAERLGLRGRVRNLPDGSVEVIAGGDEKEIDRLITWLHKGPPMARVATLTEKDWPEPIEENSFEVRY